MPRMTAVAQQAALTNQCAPITRSVRASGPARTPANPKKPFLKRNGPKATRRRVPSPEPEGVAVLQLDPDNHIDLIINFNSKLKKFRLTFRYSF